MTVIFIDVQLNFQAARAKTKLGRMSVWDNGPPPTTEFHFLIVFAGNSNSTIGTKRSICV